MRNEQLFAKRLASRERKKEGGSPKNNNGGALYCVAACSFYDRLYFSYRCCQQFILQGNGKSEMFAADVKSNSWSIVNNRSRGRFRGGKRSGVMRSWGRWRNGSGVMSRWGRQSRSSGWARSRNCINVISGSGLMMNGSGFRSGTSVVARTLRHCLVAKSADQANHNHCCKKLLHDVCLLYWQGL